MFILFGCHETWKLQYNKNKLALLLWEEKKEFFFFKQENGFVFLTKKQNVKDAYEYTVFVCLSRISARFLCLL